ncbi:zf-HC2 domain-containing protein [Streptomyces sp. WMMC1477]|uniref:zf-HC2 domain-containing protein n=1 Tax=Streptomyces sp. WMMC1477 TaxID=3015155 RepID=UPI0022B692EB|nr:zf-HC2 domain-containing protein [Streptomyces sp. WMMC1477]MCZ7432531.1 zf-HC2 domain-containing protein [Streptomyces sp. WMMC1477]
MTASFATSGDGHPETEEIADLAEELLAPHDAERLRAHLAECGPCRDIRAALDEVHGALGTLTDPGPMPGEVADRIDAALAAEAAQRSTPPGPSVTTPPGPRAVSRETRRPSAGAGGTTGPGRAPRPGARRRSRRHTVLLGAAGIAAVAIGGLFAAGMLTDRGDSGANQIAGKQQDAAVDRLEEQVHTLLAPASKVPESDTAQPEKVPEGPGPQQQPQNPFTVETADPALPQCIARGVDREETPIAVGQEDYQGTASYLVVLPHPGDTSRVDAYVIDAACVTQAPESQGERLAFRTLDRP